MSPSTQTSWMLVVSFVFLLWSCASQNITNTNDYSLVQVKKIEQGDWVIEGKVSFNDHNRIFAGSFVWQSNNGDFNLYFFNQINHQSIVLSGNYFLPGVKIQEGTTIKKIDNLNQALSNIFNWSLDWRNLVLWMGYQIPQSAIKTTNQNNPPNFFQYQNFTVEYLSFHLQKAKNEINDYFLERVKLMRVSELKAENPKTLKISISKYQFKP